MSARQISKLFAEVIADLCERDRLGWEKLRRELRPDTYTLRESLQNSYEEALDLAIYLRGAIDQLDRVAALQDATGCTISGLDEG